MPRHGNLRASDGDREEVVERLRTAAHEGRLTPDELADRVSAALTARTYSELAATVIDLPDPSRPRSRGARAERRPSPQRRVGVWALGAVRDNPLLLLVMVPLVAVTGAMLIAISTMWLTMLLVFTLLGLRGPRYARHPWRAVAFDGRGRRGGRGPRGPRGGRPPRVHR